MLNFVGVNLDLKRTPVNLMGGYSIDLTVVNFDLVGHGVKGVYHALADFDYRGRWFWVLKVGGLFKRIS